MAVYDGAMVKKQQSVLISAVDSARAVGHTLDYIKHKSCARGLLCRVCINYTRAETCHQHQDNKYTHLLINSTQNALETLHV